MKHYPVLVAGKKAAACVEAGWEWAVVSIKFPHRKGQLIKIDLSENNFSSVVWFDAYDTYTAVRFKIRQADFSSPVDAINHCIALVKSAETYINFNVANQELVSKELMIALN